MDGSGLRSGGAGDKGRPARGRPGGLVCVSHREPYVKVKGTNRLELTTGGLVTALDAALREMGGSWIATGEKAAKMRSPADQPGRGYEVTQLAVSNDELDGYYAGFSNGALWPLYHYFVGRMRFSASEWSAYETVNQRFADALSKTLARDPGAIAWVHDYQLSLVPAMVRANSPSTPIGFFLHVPFPAFEVFRILPVRRQILEGMLGADLLGFHTESYREAFLDAARKLLGARVDRAGVVEHGGRRTRTLASPIGIDVDAQVAIANDPKTTEKVARLRRSINAEHILLGVDRLDYSKGIPERLAGYERLLELHPEHRGRVCLVQVAVPSRTRVDEYRSLKRQIDETVGRINGRFGDAAWTPVRYTNKPILGADLVAYYRAADVAVVTPLRDGLNLVAKEFVASRIHMGGALVLSEFAGAAEELPQAYLVNPYGADGLAEAMHAALTDEKPEREARMTALAARVHANDIHEWARSFVEALRRGN